MPGTLREWKRADKVFGGVEMICLRFGPRPRPGGKKAVRRHATGQPGTAGSPPWPAISISCRRHQRSADRQVRPGFPHRRMVSMLDSCGRLARQNCCQQQGKGKSAHPALTCILVVSYVSRAGAAPICDKLTHRRDGSTFRINWDVFQAAAFRFEWGVPASITGNPDPTSPSPDPCAANRIRSGCSWARAGSLNSPPDVSFGRFRAHVGPAGR